MKELFFSELRRFRKAALVSFAVHLLVQLFVQRMTNLLLWTWEVHMLILGLYTLAGVAFAMIQFGSYRQPGRWLWLLHRPVSHPRVFAAIAMASTVLIAFAVGLPVLLTVAGAGLLSGAEADSRHYLMVLFVVLMTSMAWLAGSYAILSERLTALAILILPLLMVVHLASGWALLLPALICLALLAYIAYSTFKPNRTAGPSGAALAATAAPLLAGLYFLMAWGGSLLYQQALILAAIHPLNRTDLPPGGYVEATRAESRVLMARGLEGAADARAAQWRRQLPMLEIANFQESAGQYPVRHQLSNLHRVRLSDDRRNVAYTFSHDAMLFQGRDKHTGRKAGTLGLGGIGDATAFPSVPIANLPYIMMPHELLYWDLQSGRMHPLIRVERDETLAREPKEVDNLLYVITNRRLIAYDKPASGSAPPPLTQRFSVTLPEPLSDLDRIDIATLMDGKLVSLTYGRRMARGEGEASQALFLVDASGRVTTVAQRALKHDFASLFEHHKWWLSPVLYTVLALPDQLLDKGRIADHGHAGISSPSMMERPRAAWFAALAAAMLSGLGGWLWLRRVCASPQRKAGWIATCVALGPPGLACLAVLEARQSRPAANKVHRPLPAVPV